MAKSKKSFGKGYQNTNKKSIPINTTEHEGFQKKHPSWTFSRCDKEKWALSECDNIHETIIAKLSSNEGMTWQEIQSASGGRKSGSNSHFIPIEDLGTDVQKRLIELKLEDVDRLFSLRLTGEKRLWGIVNDNGVFSILWYDPHHKIYPVKRDCKKFCVN